jgi:hypothetical protein
MMACHQNRFKTKAAILEGKSLDVGSKKRRRQLPPTTANARLFSQIG